MKNLILVCALLASHLIVAQPTEEQIRQVEEAKKIVKAMKGKKFPDFDFTTLDGKRYSNETLAGKVYLFNFWFVGCRPCVEELPDINALAQEFESEGVVFLAPTFDERPKVEKWIKRFPFEYEVITDEKDFIIGNEIREFPTHFVVDQNGTIQRVVIGYSVMTDNMLRKAVNKLIR